MDIDKISNRYAKQELFLAVGLFLIALLVIQVWYLQEIFTPVVISTLFTLVVSATVAVVWRRVAKRSPENLPTFYTAVSGFRLLLALAVMFVYYLVQDDGSMLTFFLVFMVFYVVSLVHHSVYFARVSNRQ